MKKIGFISMILVMAMGLVGVGYAAWTDTVTISGTVNTGDVDLEVLRYSGTYVWKVDDAANGDIFVKHGWTDEIGFHGPPANAIDAFPNDGEGDMDPVAYAMASFAGDDAIIVDFWNMFPSIDFTADFLLHYNGSIPVKVSVSDIAVNGPPELTNNATISILYYEADAQGNIINQTPLEIPLMQLHQSNYIVVVITIHLDQTNVNMLQNGTVTGSIEVKQWNEVP